MLPTLVVGLLGTGGSAFWASFLGWAKYVKDIKKDNAQTARANRATAEEKLLTARAERELAETHARAHAQLADHPKS